MKTLENGNFFFYASPRLTDLVDEIVSNDGLWFDAKAITEAYLQQEFRRLLDEIKKSGIAKMKKSEAITIQNKDENRAKFPVFVWEEDGRLVTEVDGKVFRAENQFLLDTKLDAVLRLGRNLFFIDEPCYEDCDKETPEYRPS